MTREQGGAADAVDELRRRLAEAERRFEGFLATTADWCWESDLEGRLTWVSPGAPLSGALLLGRARWQIAEADPGADAQWRRHREDLRAGRPFRDFRYTLRRPDGGLLHVSISGDPLRGADGRLTGWLGTGRDVTAEAQAVTQLADSRARLVAQLRLLARLAAEDPLPASGLQAALQTIVAAAAAAFDVRYASIWLIDRDAGEIRCAASWDVIARAPAPRPRVRLADHAPHLERLAEEGVVAIEDTANEPLDPARAPHLPALGIGAILDAAIWRDGAVVGSFVLSHVGGPRSWPIEERSMAGSLAALIARTLEAADRRAAERAAIERDRFFTALLENTADGITVLEPNGEVKFQSATSLKSRGLEPGEIVGTSAFDHLHPDDAPRLRGEFEGARGAIGVTASAGRVWTRDGRWLTYEFRITDRTSDPAIGGFIVNARDITERLAREEELRQSEQRYRVLAEGSVQGLMMVVEGRCAYVNPVFCEITGYSEDELLGELPIDLLSPGEEALHEFRRRRVAGEEPPPLRGVLRIRRKDGSHGWVDTAVRPIQHQGRPGSLISIYDVTELRRKQAELEASERRFRDLTEGSLQGVTINQGGLIVYANEALCRTFGYAPDELLGRDRWMLVAPDDLARVKRSIREEAPERFSFRGRRKDGGLLWLDCINREISWDGAVAWQIVMMDVTERRRAEEQLRQSQKMEAIGQLTGGVAHDFNNLLAVILGNLDLIRDAAALPPTEARMLESVMAAAGRGAELTRSLLAFARRQQLHPASSDLNALVGRAAALFRRTLGEDVRVETVLDAPLWPALVDPALLESALLNLALNARDAMPRGGALTFETQNVRLAPEALGEGAELAPGDYVMLAVSDTGVGMDAEVRRRAFEPFFTTKEVGKGTGLGLSMVYGFVKQSGGHVKLYSEAGVGTTFKLYLPRAAGVDAGERDEPRTAQVDPGLRVLLVEDDAEVRTTTLAMLCGLGCRVEAAGDGDGALAALASERPFDLLLTDVVLPGELRGPELAARARALRPELAVLYMTGYAPMAALALPELRAGVVLSKPFRRAELASALSRARAA